ncbi:hypothetical protein F2Q69_00052170 [Brassica cretica]|uniref:Uncharacterized protein n=1 Tax=Brassica cretica TaxID=69181 RepID=A0A8S9MZ61_BRACR|nr:hypothetical protein F2Q69_00052170 [Brassica cretica]
MRPHVNGVQFQRNPVAEKLPGMKPAAALCRGNHPGDFASSYRDILKLRSEPDDRWQPCGMKPTATKLRRIHDLDRRQCSWAGNGRGET